MEVKMLENHTGPKDKRKVKGLVYSLPDEYALDLINQGLAVIVTPPVMFARPKAQFRPRGKTAPKGKK